MKSLSLVLILATSANAGVMWAELQPPGRKVEPWIFAEVYFDDVTGEAIDGRIRVAFGSNASNSTNELHGATGTINRDSQSFDLDVQSMHSQVGNPETISITPTRAAFRTLEYDIEVKNMIWPVAGDTNLDGVFDSSDLVKAFAGHCYNRCGWFWEQGDWNFDYVFDSGDLVAAMRTGSYQTGAVAVPEPSAVLLLVIGLFTQLYRRRRCTGRHV